MRIIPQTLVLRIVYFYPGHNFARQLGGDPSYDPSSVSVPTRPLGSDAAHTFKFSGPLSWHKNMGT